MSTGVLLAVSGPREGELVRLLDAPGTGVRVVRRCADVPEMLAAAMAGLGAVAVMSGDLAGVDRTLVSRLASAGVRSVLVAADADVERCGGLGAESVLPAGAPPQEWAAAVVAAAAGGEQGDARAADDAPRLRPAAARCDGDAGDVVAEDSGTPGVPTGLDGRAGAAVEDDGATAPDEPPEGRAAPGRLVVVWGPSGAPGRTTVAVNLAAELAAAGEECLLVDADTEAPSVAQVLGLLDETAGIAAAARSAAHGRLDSVALARACVSLGTGLRVLSGLTRPDRWRELPPSSLEVVWERARDLAAWTVVDTGAGIEGAGAGFEPAFAPRRHQATLSALAAADVVVVVGAGEPVGIHRLVTALHELDDRGLRRPGTERIVLVNRVRASAAGPAPERSIQEALVRFADVGTAVLVPDDRPALDRCVLNGATLAQEVAGSPARDALADLAGRLAGTGVTRRQRRRAARSRTRGQH